MASNKKHENIKLKVGDLIIKLNKVEKKVKKIITEYINTEKSYFVQYILLNNLIISFSGKVKALEYIIREEEIETHKDFMRSFKILMTKRNMIAHSDTLLDDFIISGFDADWNQDGIMDTPIFEDAEPVVTTINNGDLTFEEVEKAMVDFEKYYLIASEELEKIYMRIRK